MHSPSYPDQVSSNQLVYTNCYLMKLGHWSDSLLAPLSVTPLENGCKDFFLLK